MPCRLRCCPGFARSGTRRSALCSMAGTCCGAWTEVMVGAYHTTIAVFECRCSPAAVHLPYRLAIAAVDCPLHAARRQDAQARAANLFVGAGWLVSAVELHTPQTCRSHWGEGVGWWVDVARARSSLLLLWLCLAMHRLSGQGCAALAHLRASAAPLPWLPSELPGMGPGCRSAAGACPESARHGHLACNAHGAGHVASVRRRRRRAEAPPPLVGSVSLLFVSCCIIAQQQRAGCLWARVMSAVRAARPACAAAAVPAERPLGQQA